ncbi:uncharacterized protein LOC108091389 [Drosophila ficusphila]|uniref:uncharacterized protein LOC108091389 n=1 Tax=Drosophila ficusphila TaxID=30025 RepID=UPI0007E85278|nr:uncharacterized protein LOC108091389 [Drosophila ficusphila]
MGAHNSKPQTVQMTNPMAFDITRDVVERIDQASGNGTKVGTSFCEKCKNNAGKSSSSDVPTTVEHKPIQVQNPRPVPAAKSWKKRSLEVEEAEFGKSLQRVQELFGKPVKWARECEGEIGKLEEELIYCYQRYKNEPLQCSNLARQYHRFVFGKQNDEISKMKGEPRVN